MNLSKKISAGLFAIFLISIFVTPVSSVLAQTNMAQGSPQTNSAAGATGGTLPNPLKNVSSISDLLYLIANIATYIGVILAVLALIWVGFKFVAAQGNAEKITEAKRYFFYIIIGVAILIGASAIISILKNTLTSAGVVQPSTFTNPN